MPDPDELERERLRCAECGRDPREGERFRALLTIDDEVAVYCPGCAEREFGDLGLRNR